VHGPLVDPAHAGGATALAAAAARVQMYASESHALGRFVFAPGTFPQNNLRRGDVNPDGAGDAADNPLGWPGLWPTVHVFASFDPTIAPTSDVALECAVTSDDDPGASGALGCADYECDAHTLHLVDRATQAQSTITPGADGFNAWKYGLWTLNYLQVMHDAGEAGVASVADGDLAGVGALDNTVVGADDDGAATAPGTYLGSSDIEGFQAALFIDEVDNRAADWLLSLSTDDGTTLSGFASVDEALQYNYTSPLRWFPGSIDVSESDDDSGFPVPSYTLGSANSSLLDLAGLAMGYAEFFSLTDTSNVDVGGAQTAIDYFDGDPFAADNQLADGEDTLHDRALAMMRVSIVNMDRLHTDPASGLLVDDVTMAGVTPTRGSKVSMTSLAYTLLSLRAVQRTLSAQLELYSNNTPDTAVGSTPLDVIALNHPSGASVTFTQRVSAMISAESSLLLDKLTDERGRAFDGWDVAANAPVDTDDTLDAHTAAVRALFAAYLSTGDVRFHDRAIAVFNRMDAVFYDADARIYGAAPAPVDDVIMTPLRFALLQSTLRDMYELVAAEPGGEALALDLESRIGRLNKLVLNGWDDRNQNRLVDYPDECVTLANGVVHGGLQMAERTLTGETGSLEEQLTPGGARTPTSDREQDCVPEIDDAHLPAALASSVTFHLAR
ncbi:MAG TPA: hypothetical protein VGO62_20495, partial [Myxococcota bacterium]